MPAGFDAPADRAELLLHQGLYAWVQTPVPDETFDGRFPG
jgi:hypothetical protein